jgi:Trypsin
LISPTRVLTAAHCVVNSPPNLVRVGQLTQIGGEAIGVDCVSIHPDYESGSTLSCLFGKSCELWNYIAIIKPSQPATTVTTFVALNSNTNYPSTSGQELTIVGFGFPNAAMGILDHLLHVLLGVQIVKKPCELLKVTTGFVPEAICQEKWSCTVPAHNTTLAPLRRTMACALV